MSEGAAPVGSPAPAPTPTVPVPAAPGQQAPPATPAPPAAASGEGAESTWYSGMSTDEQAFIAGRHWEGPSDLLKSYQNLERLRGVSADRLAKIPDWNNADEVAEFNTRVGVPEAADGYQGEPVQLSNGAELDSVDLQGIAHRVGMTQRQLDAFLPEVKGYFDSALASQEQEIAVRDAAEKIEWESESGKSLNEREFAILRLRQASPTADEAFETIERVLGYKKARQLYYETANRTGEAQRGDSGSSASQGGGFEPTPEVARQMLVQKRTDKAFFERLRAGDVSATQEWSRLNKIAASGQKVVD